MIRFVTFVVLIFQKKFLLIFDFDVCHKCINLPQKYALIDFYHAQTELKNYSFPFHKHKLIYCRTSRSKNKGITWICDLCFNNYENKIWLFYCTNCDYDVCLSCLKKYIPKNEFINNIAIKIDDHCHNLIYRVTNRNWICNFCKNSYPNFVPTYYCTKCDFDVCKNFMKNISDENKYPLLFKGKRENYNIKTINNSSTDFWKKK